MSIDRNESRVLAAYIEAALWASTTDDGEPMDREYGPDDIALPAKAKMLADVRDAIRETYNIDGVELWTDDQFGHDLWLTRNGHGTGFWDRMYGTDELGRLLTDVARKMGESDLYVGDDGLIWVA